MHRILSEGKAGKESWMEKCTQSTFRWQGVPQEQHSTLRPTNILKHEATHSQIEHKMHSVHKARAEEWLCSSQVRNRSTQMDHECKHWLTRAVQIGPLKARQRWMEMPEQEHKAAQFLPLSRSGSITVLVIELLAVMLLLRLKKIPHSKSLFPCKTVRCGAQAFTSEVAEATAAAWQRRNTAWRGRKKPNGLQSFVLNAAPDEGEIQFHRSSELGSFADLPHHSKPRQK